MEDGKVPPAKRRRKNEYRVEEYCIVNRYQSTV